MRDFILKKETCRRRFLMLNKYGPFIYIHTLLGYLFFLLRCLFVCIQINVKTAEPIGAYFFVGPRMTPGKVYERLIFQKFDFWKLWKSTKLFTMFLFNNVLQRDHVHNWNRRWARSALKASFETNMSSKVRIWIVYLRISSEK